MNETTDIAVIGAGVIGLAIAHRLALAGREAVVLDPNEPGSGASWGNAGTIADYAVQPVGTPTVLKTLPTLLFDRNSPLSIHHAALPTLAPWLMRFASQSLPGAAKRNAAALAGLLSDAAPRWQALAAEIGGADLLRDRGCLYWYQTDAAFRAAQADIAFRQGLGVSADLIGAAELHSLEPALPVAGGGRGLFPHRPLPNRSRRDGRTPCPCSQGRRRHFPPRPRRPPRRHGQDCPPAGPGPFA